MSSTLIPYASSPLPIIRSSAANLHQLAQPARVGASQTIIAEIIENLRGDWGAPLLEKIAALDFISVDVLRQLMKASAELALPKGTFAELYCEADVSAAASITPLQRLYFGIARIAGEHIRLDSSQAQAVLSEHLLGNSASSVLCALIAVRMAWNRSLALSDQVAIHLESDSIDIRCAALEAIADMDVKAQAYAAKVVESMHSLPPLSDKVFFAVCSCVERSLRELHPKEVLRHLRHLWESPQPLAREIAVSVGFRLSEHPRFNSVCATIHQAAQFAIKDDKLSHERLRAAYERLPLSALGVLGAERLLSMPDTGHQSQNSGSNAEVTIGDIMPFCIELICNDNRYYRSMGLNTFDIMFMAPRTAFRCAIGNLDKLDIERLHLEASPRSEVGERHAGAKHPDHDAFRMWLLQFEAQAEILELLGQLHPSEAKNYLASFRATEKPAVIAGLLRCLAHVEDVNLKSEIAAHLNRRAHHQSQAAAIRACIIGGARYSSVLDLLLERAIDFYSGYGRAGTAAASWSELVEAIKSVSVAEPQRAIERVAQIAINTHDNPTHFCCMVELLDALCDFHEESYSVLSGDTSRSFQEIITNMSKPLLVREAAAKALAHCGHRGDLVTEGLCYCIGEYSDFSMRCLSTLERIGRDAVPYGAKSAYNNLVDCLLSYECESGLHALPAANSIISNHSAAFSRAIRAVYYDDLEQVVVRVLSWLACKPLRELSSLKSSVAIAGALALIAETIDSVIVPQDLLDRLGVRLEKLLKHGDVTVRCNAAIVLGKLGPMAAAAVPSLRAIALEDTCAELREICHEVLGEIGEPRALVLDTLLGTWRTIMKAARSPTLRPEIRAQCPSNRGVYLGLAALMSREPELVHVLEDAFYEANTSAAKGVLRALAAAPWCAGVQRLYEIAFLHPRDDVRREAVLNINVQAHGRYLSGLLQQLERFDPSSEVVKSASFARSQTNSWLKLVAG